MTLLIQDTMMRGGTNIRKIIENYLRVQVPAAIDIMRNQNADLDAAHLPYPKMYNATDPMQTEVYPYIGAFVTGAHRVIRTDVEPSGALEYDIIYETTLFVTASTANLGLDESNIPKWEQPYRTSAIRVRDDLMSVMLDVILNGPSLGTAGNRYRASLNESSLRLSYPEPIKHGDNSNPVWVCSGLMVADISLIETTVAPYYGTAQEVDVDIFRLPLF